MREMKDSGIEWIGEMPEEWVTEQVGRRADQIKCKNDGMIETNLLSLSYGKVKRRDINATEGLLPKSFEGHNIIEENDIVLRFTDLQNDQKSLRVGRAAERGIITSAYTTIRPFDSEDSEFLYYALHSYDLKKGFYGMGAGVRQGLKWQEAKCIEIPWPDVQTRLSVCRFLDGKCTEIDKAIEAAEASIEEYKLYKKSVIFQAVTKGLDHNVPMKDSGVDHFDVIPVHWTTVPLKRVAHEIKKGISPSYSAEGEAFVVKQASFSHGFLDWSKVDRADATSCTKKGLLHKDDVLIATTGGGVLGKVYCLEIDRALFASTDVGVISVNSERYESRLLYYFLSVNYENINGTMATGSTNQTHLQMRAFSDMQIPLPPRKEQVELVRHLDQIVKDIDDAIASKRQIIDELKAYKKSLIWEAVTGKREVV